MTAEPAYRELSLWHDTAADHLTPRPALPGDLDTDVAIVGAGFTGLWTAYYLRRLDPGIRIAVLEREIAGFGASGRNGGWCSALFPASAATVAKRHGRQAAIRLHRAMVETVDEVGRVAAAEGIDCHFAKGGTVVLARTPVQLDRAAADVAEAAEFGTGSDDLVLLSADEASRRAGATSVLGGTFTPHCAAIHPGRLVRGLARVVVAAGVSLYEQTPVTALKPGLVETPHGRIRARFVIRATEGYTPQLPGYRRAVAPVYSLMIATEPLPEQFWATAGLAHRETFADYRHLIIYGQRTADNRFAFGGRGAPYHFGSTIRPEFDRDPAVFAELHAVLRELFPASGDAAVTHRWGGPLGIPRDWFASVGLDRASGRGWAGGYVGDGVGTTNLAGRTLADLVLGRDSELVTLPWVGHRSPRWEPEPLRWLGMNVGLRMMSAADREEERTGRPSRRAALFSRFLGH
ncbi:MAG: FAD-binding oxidoreductase [Sporichthyaceae bacterium]|nr:FAD-binding oxidoreductase [Sporichthyaceae bacterium]